MGMCNLIITRKKQIVASLASCNIIIDDIDYGAIKNGSVLQCSLNDGNHEITLKWWRKRKKSVFSDWKMDLSAAQCAAGDPCGSRRGSAGIPEYAAFAGGCGNQPAFQRGISVDGQPECGSAGAVSNNSGVPAADVLFQKSVVSLADQLVYIGAAPADLGDQCVPSISTK